MLLLTLSQPNSIQLRSKYSGTARYGWHLFVAKSIDFQDLPRFEPEQDQNIECSSNCNASLHNIKSKLKINGEEWYINKQNVPR
ncbi:MAG: hypothetical protein QNJ70_08325 [Xenococcaceae cyanobacterium MO_207.B15]|nr:hypothetical protein [Xenococcaceae cyanobacterium MO_207.B15]MDJ0744223.1 hypothetical protein [Xenococcaceae cyanobacterium MO_167.B27]